jgi:hypothetical protein
LEAHVIASVHIAEVGPRRASRLFRRNIDRRTAPGLRHGVVTTTAMLGGELLPRATLGRVGLIAAWDDDAALDRFLAEHALARELADGWRVRLRASHVFGHWREVPDFAAEATEALDDDEPAAAVTIGHMRLARALPFLRASAKAEAQAIGDPSLIAALGLARPPRLVGTFSLWRTLDAMRAYARGDADVRHRDASRAHAARPFHHDAAFIRCRPYAAEGSWDGIELREVVQQGLGAR